MLFILIIKIQYYEKSILLVLLISLFTGSIYAQSSISSTNIGDTFIIGEVDKDNYKHINFPKVNFIIKRGGIANFKNIKGRSVEVISIEEKRYGSLGATIKLTSNRKFFGSHRYVTVDLPEALEVD